MCGPSADLFTCLYPQDTVQFLGESPHCLSPRLWGLIKIILCLQTHSRRRLLFLGTSHSFSFIVFPDLGAPIFPFHEVFIPLLAVISVTSSLLSQHKWKLTAASLGLAPDTPREASLKFTKHMNACSSQAGAC